MLLLFVDCCLFVLMLFDLDCFVWLLVINCSEGLLLFCLLCDVCCLLFVVCCLFLVGCSLLFAVGRLSVVCCWLLCVVYRQLSVVE